MTDILSFKQKLIDKDNPPEKTEAAISLLTDFHNYLQERDKTFLKITDEDFYAFSNHLIKNETNTRFNYEIIITFGHFLNNKNLVRLGREVFDGIEVIENLSKRLTEEYSKDFRDKIFGRMDLPPLGLDPKAKPDYTKKLISKLVEEIGEVESEKFLAKGLRDSYYEWRKPDREKFLKAKNIDEFLKEKRERQIENLEKHRDEETLYFTQEINDDVVEYVKNDLRIETGVREGNILTTTKIPHETLKFLNETDEKMKAYYYCHCPWVKEAIKDGTVDQIPDVFCNCSGGYYRSYWEIVLDQPVEVKTLKTVIRGDPVCEFAIELPENVVENLN
ncbi:MAG: hypothetical protein HGN29_03370 [Asgard group archaeon]|nr:hypothetical protein [Asgard group archaeon]